MNRLQTFNHSLFGNVRVLTNYDTPLFNLYDIGFSLGYTRPNANGVVYLRKDKLVNICESLGIKGVTPGVTSFPVSKETDFESTFIEESDLYDLSLESRAKHARQFRKWITSEVIPSIRKHGAYMTPETIEQALLNPDTIIQLATNLKEEQQKRLEAEKKIQLQKPKVVYADAVAVSEDTVLVKDFDTVLKQKGVDIGTNRLFDWLRNNGYLCKQKGELWNTPTQRSLDLGVMVTKHGLRTGSNGEMKKTRTPKVTGKGQIYFINKFLNQQEVV